jgi:hypothetical protein
MPLIVGTRGPVALCVLVAAQVASHAPAARADDALVAVYQKGCDGGDAFQCNALGMELERSSQGPAERARAAAVFEKACGGGALLACVNAGDLYMSGIGIAQDPKKAEALYRLACDGKVREVDACARLAKATAASAAQVTNTSTPKAHVSEPGQSASQSGAPPSGSARDASRRTDFWWLGEDKVEGWIVLIDKSTIRPGKAGQTSFLLEFISVYKGPNAAGQPVSGYLVSRYQASVDCAHKRFSAPVKDDYLYVSTETNQWSGKLLSHGPSEDLPSGPIEPGTSISSAYNFVCRKMQDPRNEADSHDENADLDMGEVLLDTTDSR